MLSPDVYSQRVLSCLVQAAASCSDSCGLQVRSIGKRDCSSLFKLGDEMIAFAALHQLLASSVADMLPVNVSVLLCDEAKRLARQGNPRVEGSPLRQVSVELSQPGSKTFEGLMSSPWKVCKEVQQE